MNQPMSASGGTPSFSTTEPPMADFPDELFVNKTYTSSGSEAPKVATVSVHGSAHPKHRLVFNALNGAVTVESDGAVPYLHHLRLAAKLTEVLNSGA